MLPQPNTLPRVARGPYGALVVLEPWQPLFHDVIVCGLNDLGEEVSTFYASVNCSAPRPDNPLEEEWTAVFPVLPPGTYNVYAPGQEPPKGYHRRATVFPGATVRFSM